VTQCRWLAGPLTSWRLELDRRPQIFQPDKALRPSRQRFVHPFMPTHSPHRRRRHL